MNKENIRLVAQAIREHADQFDLSTFGSTKFGAHKSHRTAHQCDTLACFCGWANIVSNETLGTFYDFNNKMAGADFLGLTYEQSKTLFLPPDKYFHSNFWAQVFVQEILPYESKASQNLYKMNGNEAAIVLEALADEKITF